ncbi:histidine phosphatase family protein [uncultured Microbulbifer sp.]|uniref:histidine phosphatase family protein n=1 Tax=uncultured Microbulbifer sp. TaxID=348147 RepID=UPI00344FBDAB
MIQILLARHGEAAKGNSIVDPALTPLGHKQAIQLASSFSKNTYLKLVSSPKLRAQQTAKPLADKLGTSISLENRVSEIPSFIRTTPLLDTLTAE